MLSGDSLIILLDDKSPRYLSSQRRVNLASVRSPRLGNAKKNVADEPWAVEAKEALLRLCAGKPVRVTVAYERVLEGTTYAHCSVVLEGTKPVDLGEEMTRRGLATVVRHKTDDPRAENYDALLLAEDRAKSEKRGIHTGKPPKAGRRVDYSADRTLAVTSLHFLKQKKRLSVSPAGICDVGVHRLRLLRRALFDGHSRGKLPVVAVSAGRARAAEQREGRTRGFRRRIPAADAVPFPPGILGGRFTSAAAGGNGGPERGQGGELRGERVSPAGIVLAGAVAASRRRGFRQREGAALLPRRRRAARRRGRRAQPAEGLLGQLAGAQTRGGAGRRGVDGRHGHRDPRGKGLIRQRGGGRGGEAARGGRFGGIAGGGRWREMRLTGRMTDRCCRRGRARCTRGCAERRGTAGNRRIGV